MLLIFLNGFSCIFASVSVRVSFVFRRILQLFHLDVSRIKKVYITPSPNYLGRTTSPSNYKIGFSTLKLSKTGQIAPQTILDSGFVFFFFIYFGGIFVKS
jgi:hypothetical protein